MKEIEKMPTKTRILYAALDLFSEKGYDGVGVDLIAEKSGLKGPSLYRHYKGKEDILNSMIDIVEQHYEDGFHLYNENEAFPSSMDELIRGAIKRIEFTVDDEIICKTRRILAMEQFRSPRIAAMATKYHMENMRNAYTVVFEEMMKKGVLKEDDPEYLALEFIAPVSLLIHTCDREPHKKEECFKVIRKHFAHFARVYGKK